MSMNDWLKVGGMAMLVFNMTLNVFLFAKARSNKRLDEMADSIAAMGARLGAKIDGHETHARHEHLIGTARDADMDKRLAMLEVRVQHMPTHNDLQGIKSELADVKGSVSALDERSENILAVVHRIQEHLMEQ